MLLNKAISQYPINEKLVSYYMNQLKQPGFMFLNNVMEIPIINELSPNVTYILSIKITDIYEMEREIQYKLNQMDNQNHLIRSKQLVLASFQYIKYILPK